MSFIIVFGTGEAVVFALRRHEFNSDVVTKTGYAIHYLAADENNRSWMGSNFGCKPYHITDN
jgi:hypothetical protein